MQSVKMPIPGDDPDHLDNEVSAEPVSEDTHSVIMADPDKAVVPTEPLTEALRPSQTGMGRLEKTLQLIRERDADTRPAGKKNQQTARQDLTQLLHDLDDVIAEIPDDVDYFDFNISRGPRPRLWIDVTTFVTMSVEGRVYKFFHDTRKGRILLNESASRDVISDAIIEYVASRLSDREKSLSSVSTQVLIRTEPAKIDEGSARMSIDDHEMSDNPTRRSPMRSFFYFILGIIVGAGALIAIAWFRAELGL